MMYGAHVLNEFLRPLVMPNLQQFGFYLQEGPDIVSTLTELTAIVNGLSRPNLVSKILYVGKSELTKVTSVLPFVTSLGIQSVLPSSEIRIMAQKDHLPNLTSLVSKVDYTNLDAFIDMLETRRVRGVEAQLSGRSTPGIIQSATIYVANAPSPESLSRLLRRFCDIQDRLKLKDSRIELVDIVSILAADCTPELP